MQSTRFLFQKFIGFIVLLIIYNIFLYIFAPGLFEDRYVVISLIVFFSYIFIEQMYKIEPPEEYKIQLQDISILLIFLFYPLILVVSFYERERINIPFLSWWNEPLIKILVIGVLILGMIITFTSRLQLGKHGTSIIVVLEDHNLVTTGIYKYIRHPIYLGALIQYTSLGVIIGSIIMTSITFIIWIILIRQRILIEETILLEKFGDEYSRYQNQTKKLIPFLY